MTAITFGDAGFDDDAARAVISLYLDEEHAMGIPAEDDLKKKLSKLMNGQEMKSLLFPEKTPVAGFPNIAIKHTGFENWFFEQSKPMQTDVRAAVHRYKIERVSYRNDVAKLIGFIHKHKTGDAVLAEVKSAATMTLVMSPFRPAADGDFNADSSGLSSVRATALGYEVRDQDGNRIQDENDEDSRGTGEGSRARIDYTPAMWGRGGSAHVSGPGSQPDEVLFHELVHAGRQMKGIASLRAVGRKRVDKKIQNEEEFIAIVVANIYLSEKRQRSFRATHAIIDNDDDTFTFDALRDPEHFLDNSQHTSLPPTALLEKLRYRQRSLYDALAQIKSPDAAFNPVRDHDKVRADGLIDI